MTATLSQLTWTEAKVNPRYRFVIAALILAAHLSIGLNFFSVTPLLPLVIDDYEVYPRQRQPADRLADGGQSP